MIDLPTLGLVIGSAIISSFNPYTIGVMILMMSVILGQGGTSSRLRKSGGSFVFAMFFAYLITGLGLTYLFSSVPMILVEYLRITIGLLVVIAGLVELKEYFWYGKGFGMRAPNAVSSKIHNWSVSRHSVWDFLLFGVFVAVIAMPFTGAPYLAVISTLKLDFSVTTAGLMSLYGLLFVAPQIAILCLVARGKKISRITKWKEKNKGAMKLSSSLLLVGLGWLLILVANGTVNFG